MDKIIEQTEDGSATLYVPELDEHYHSVKGARTESSHIFIDMGLKISKARHPRVMEVGFGTGLNALLTLEEAERSGRPVNYTALELYPLKWEQVEALHYSDNPLFRTLHDAPWEQSVAVTPLFTLCKTQADVTLIAMPTLVSDGSEADEARIEEQYRRLSSVIRPTYDVIYFDAFAPEKQPEMWTEGLFRTLYASLRPGGLLVTYCAKGTVRRTLQRVGFLTERLPGPPGGKREILRGVKSKDESLKSKE